MGPKTTMFGSTKILEDHREPKTTMFESTESPRKKHGYQNNIL